MPSNFSKGNRPSNQNDPANPTVNPDNTTVKDPSNPDSVTTGGTSKTDPPPPIDRENLSTTDKLVIDTLGLDKLEPGEKKTIGASALGKFGAGFYAGLGGSAKLSIERDKTDPNKFNIAVELEPKVEGGGAIEAVGEGVDGKASFSKKVVVNLQADFSKKGEATEFVAFVAQAGLAATLPAIAAPLLIAENIPGVNLPGEPVDYVRSRIKSVEVGVGLSTEISGKLVAGLGIEASLANSLSGGGKLDFNDNGTYTITTNTTLGVKGEANVLAGGPGAVVNVPGLGEELNLSLEGSTIVDKTGKVLSSDARIKLSTRLQAGNAGKEFELSISVKDLIKQVPPEVGARLAETVSRGDSFAAAKIFQTEILPKFNVSFDYKSRTFTNDKAALKADGSISGFGVEGSVEFASEKTIATEESKATISVTGIAVEREIEENGVKRKVNKNLTFSDLKKEVSNLVSNTTQNLQDTTNKTIKPRKTLNILNRGLLGNLLG